MDPGELIQYLERWLNGLPSQAYYRERTGLGPGALVREIRAALKALPEPRAQKRLSLEPWEPRGDEVSALVDNMASEMRGLSGTLVIMGSLADGTATGYSDVDAAYFAPDEEFFGRIGELRRALKRVARRILGFDHLQHHGVFVLPASGAKKASPLPPSGFQGARVVFGPGDILLGGWRSGKIRGFLEKCKTLHEDPDKRPRGLYGIKLFLSQLMLMPAAFFLARGEDIAKPEALARAHEMFPRGQRALKTATEIRVSWKRPKSQAFSAGIRVWPSPWGFAFAFRRFFRAPAPLLARLDDGFYEACGLLARSMENALEG